MRTRAGRSAGREAPVPFRVPLAIAHPQRRMNERTNERTTNRSAAADSEGGEGGNALPPPLSHSDHFRFRSYTVQASVLALRFLAIVREFVAREFVANHAIAER